MTRVGVRRQHRKHKVSDQWIQQFKRACEENEQALFHDCEEPDRSVPCAAREAEGPESSMVDACAFIVEDVVKSEPRAATPSLYSFPASKDVPEEKIELPLWLTKYLEVLRSEGRVHEDTGSDSEDERVTGPETIRGLCPSGHQLRSKTFSKPINGSAFIECDICC